MTSRERVLMALSHEEPDRVPIDFGSTGCTGISKTAYENLKAHLGVTESTRVIDFSQQLAEVDEVVLERFSVDTRRVSLAGAENRKRIDFPDGSYVDEWGVVRRRAEGGFYYDVVKSPLAGEATESQLAQYSWPDPRDRGRLRGVRQRAKDVVERGYASVLHLTGGGFISQSQLLRGFENWYSDILLAPEGMEALLDRTLAYSTELAKAAMEEAGEYCDVVMIGDDIATQAGPMISPALYRKHIKPRQAKLFAILKSGSSAKILYHSCGAVTALMDDLVEIGVEIINPVQVRAFQMDPKQLKQRYGSRLSFWGGIDTQDVLPRGSVETVREEVRRRIDQMGQQGGYIVNSVHNIQPDVPPENVCALFDAAVKYGGYPLQTKAGLTA